MHYSFNMSVLTYYDPTSAARVLPDRSTHSRTQELPVSAADSGFIYSGFLPSDDPLVDPTRVLFMPNPSEPDPYVHVVRGENFFASSTWAEPLQCGREECSSEALLCRREARP